MVSGAKHVVNLVPEEPRGWIPTPEMQMGVCAAAESVVGSFYRESLNVDQAVRATLAHLGHTLLLQLLQIQHVLWQAKCCIVSVHALFTATDTECLTGQSCLIHK
jgi:hypothetical protein